MPTWGEAASAETRRDIEALLQVCADMAGKIVSRGPSHPFVVSMALDGTVVVRSVHVPTDAGDPWAAAAGLVEVVHAQATRLRAAVVVATCGDVSAPRLQAIGDHRAGPPFFAQVDYRFTADGSAVVSHAVLEPTEGSLL